MCFFDDGALLPRLRWRVEQHGQRRRQSAQSSEALDWQSAQFVSPVGLPSSPRSAQHQRCGWHRCALLPHARWGHKGYLRQRLAVGWLAAGLGSVRPLGDGIWTGLVCRHFKVVCAGDLSSLDSLDGRATTLTLCAAWGAAPCRLCGGPAARGVSVVR